MAWKLIRHFDPKSDDHIQGIKYMQGPVAIQIDNFIRIYYADRDLSGKSFPAFFDLDIDNLDTIINTKRTSIIPWGPRGTFDDDGIMPACIISKNENFLMYYSGWNRRLTVPYHNTIGLAVSEDNGNSFKRMFDGPILDRSHFDPFMVVTPWILNSDKWDMWYVSGISWLEIDGKLEPTYGIRHAQSTDGIFWIPEGKNVIPMRHAEEAIARPTIISYNNTYHMWYSYRNSRDFRDGNGSYKIGYSYSIDKINWTRADHLAGFFKSGNEWDEFMQCYPYIININGSYYLFYNGNSFGKTGIGLSIWEGPLPLP